LWDVIFVEVLVFFFFQAEDGIRDSSVTGVQTCALPICFLEPAVEPQETTSKSPVGSPSGNTLGMSSATAATFAARIRTMFSWLRSEERRVGKECRSRWATSP